MKKTRRLELPARQWFKLILSDRAVADGGIKRIINVFEKIMPAGDESKRCALFMREEKNATVVFITPQFAAADPQLPKTLSAVESEPPPPRRAGESSGTSLLLASHSIAWSMLK